MFYIHKIRYSKNMNKVKQTDKYTISDFSSMFRPSKMRLSLEKKKKNNNNKNNKRSRFNRVLAPSVHKTIKQMYK